MSASLPRAELVRLVERVFRPGPEDHRLALLVDLPDAKAADHPAWSARREMMAEWHRSLLADRDKLSLEEGRLIHYANVGRNNAKSLACAGAVAMSITRMTAESRIRSITYLTRALAGRMHTSLHCSATYFPERNAAISLSRRATTSG